MMVIESSELMIKNERRQSNIVRPIPAWQSGHHNKNDADLVLISHNHFDHMSLEDLRHVINKQTTISWRTQECVQRLRHLELEDSKE